MLNIGDSVGGIYKKSKNDIEFGEQEELSKDMSAYLLLK